MNRVIRSVSADDTQRLGEFLGALIEPPEIIELCSDLGGGKTTFVKGLTRGVGSKDIVSSPTFTLNKIYKGRNVEIHHFDFYRLKTPGVVSDQLQESLHNPSVVTVVEWSDIVKNVLPQQRLIIEFKAVAENEEERIVTFKFPESKIPLIEALRTRLEKVEP